MIGKRSRRFRRVAAIAARDVPLGETSWNGTSLAPSLQIELSRVRADVLRVCQMLLSPTPEVLDQCSVLLETTTKALAGCRPQPDGNAGALTEALKLRAAVRRARLLLDTACAFHQAWIKRLSAMSGGYTAYGEPAVMDRGYRLAVRG